MPRCSPLRLFLVFLSILFVIGCNDQFEPIGDIDPDVPFPITDLALVAIDDTTRLTWTATGDDGPNGTASRYDLRRLGTALDEGSWADATPIEGLPNPGPSGSPEKFDLAVGNPPPSAYLALKVVDDAGNHSKLSNIIHIDLSPPDGVEDLETSRVTDTFVSLQWTAPSDDGPLGRPYRYEVRWGPEELTLENWYDSTPAGGPTHPVEAGATQGYTIFGLSPVTHYYAAVRSRDEADNLSGISNLVEFTTTASPVGWWEGFTELRINGSVNSLKSIGDTLYVGGRFNSVGGEPFTGISAWDGADWHSLGAGLSGGHYGTFLMNMESFNGDLYVGGSFNYAGGNLAPNIARWTGSGWESLGNSQLVGHPWAQGVYAGKLYVGWIFNNFSRWPFEFLTGFDGTTLHPMGWNQENHHVPHDIIEYDGKMVICSQTPTVDGMPSSSVLFWDGFEYTAPEPTLSGGYWNEPMPSDLCVYKGDLIVAGEFTTAGGLTVNHIARWDGSSWHGLGGGLGGERVTIGDLTVYRGYLAVGGQFETAGGRPANNIALWDGAYWIPLGEGLESPEMGGNVVEALEVHAGSLYVGGRFETMDGKPSSYLARWDLD